MLTSALHTARAIKASIQIMEAFVEMSHCIQQNRQLLSYQKPHILSDRQDIIEADVKRIKSSMVTKSDISEFIKYLYV